MTVRVPVVVMLGSFFALFEPARRGVVLSESMT